ncbi:MAG: polyprenyl synthetase family protein [Prevotella sp.]|nr:polyprenyl synthetase family protein [Prevotella sp.]
MDYLSLIKAPIESELDRFVELFNESLSHSDGLLGQALAHIRARGGKRMRPILVLLTARLCGEINDSTLRAAVGLELLHTASLVHDDVVDESTERRGQASVNASYDNKVAVLVGDYVLSTCLLQVSKTGNEVIFRHIAELGRTLSNGEILQLTNTSDNGLSEDVYFDVIRKKTAALFESCCSLGAISAGVDEHNIGEMAEFGQNIGTIFQIRDDIFDYFDSTEIGKPTGNDMAEGKLTLPVLYVLKQHPYESMQKLAAKVKDGTINADEIAVLVEYAKKMGGIDYASKKMDELSARCHSFVDKYVTDPVLRQAFNCYIDYVSVRDF